jgi:hypothetical protein
MRVLRTIAPAALAGWLAIDVYMSVAVSLRGRTPLALFQWDASNLLGSAAYAGGLGSAAFGLAADFVVSFLWAAVCVAVMQRVPAAREYPVVFGTIFGAVVMLVMLWVVVPLGHAAPASMSVSSIAITSIGHTAFFGVPVAWVAARGLEA